MALSTQTLDFKAKRDQVRSMTIDAIQWSIADCIATLEPSKEMDMLDNGYREGYYQDEISVLKAELNRRERQTELQSLKEKVRMIERDLKE